MVIIDTTIWIDFFKGRETSGVSRFVKLLQDEVDLFTTGFIVQEILSGIKSTKDRNEVKSDLDAVLLIMPSLSNHIHAAEIVDGCRQKGFTIRSSVDCLIASLAIEYGLKVLEDDRDFRNISKVFPLKIEQHD